MKPAARIEDSVEHSSALLGFLAGASIVALVVVSGGVGLAAVCAATAVGGLAGAGVAKLINPAIESGALIEGSCTVRINKKYASAVLDKADCFIPVVYPHGPQAVVEGSSSVLIHCRPAARVGDSLLCGAKIAEGSPNVLIGGGTSRVVGTERNLIDTFLDYSSAYLTALSFGFNPISTTSFAVGGNLVTRAMQNANMDGGSIVGSMLEKTLGKYGAMMIHSDVIVEGLSKSTRPLFLYGRYWATKRLSGNTPWSFGRYLNNNIVSNQLSKPSSNLKLSTGKGLSMLGISFVVDGVRIWRDQARLNNVPDKHSICCSDSSWLEPA